MDITQSTSTNLMTKDDASLLEAKIMAGVYRLRTDIYRALWIQGAGIVAALGIIFAIATALG